MWKSLAVGPWPVPPWALLRWALVPMRPPAGCDFAINFSAYIADLDFRARLEQHVHAPYILGGRWQPLSGSDVAAKWQKEDMAGKFYIANSMTTLLQNIN